MKKSMKTSDQEQISQEITKYPFAHLFGSDIRLRRVFTNKHVYIHNDTMSSRAINCVDKIRVFGHHYCVIIKNRVASCFVHIYSCESK